MKSRIATLAAFFFVIVLVSCLAIWKHYQLEQESREAATRSGTNASAILTGTTTSIKVYSDELDISDQPVIQVTDVGNDTIEISSEALGVRFAVETQVSIWSEPSDSSYTLSDKEECVLEPGFPSTTTLRCIAVSASLGRGIRPFASLEYTGAAFEDYTYLRTERSFLALAKNVITDPTTDVCSLSSTDKICDVKHLSGDLAMITMVDSSHGLDTWWSITYVHTVAGDVATYSITGAGASGYHQIQESIEFFEPTSTDVVITDTSSDYRSADTIVFNKDCVRSADNHSEVACTSETIEEAFSDDESKVHYKRAHNAWFDSTLRRVQEDSSRIFFSTNLGSEGNVLRPLFVYNKNTKQFRYSGITHLHAWKSPDRDVLVYMPAENRREIRLLRYETLEDRLLYKLKDTENIYYADGLGSLEGSGWIDDARFGLRLYSKTSLPHKNWLYPFDRFVVLDTITGDVSTPTQYYTFIQSDNDGLTEADLVYVPSTGTHVVLFNDVGKHLEDLYGGRVHVLRADNFLLYPDKSGGITFTHSMGKTIGTTTEYFLGTSSYNLTDDTFQLLDVKRLDE